MADGFDVRRSIIKAVLMSPVLLAAIWWLQTDFPWDRAVSDKFYDFSARHFLWPKSDAALNLRLHEIPKILAIAAGCVFVGMACTPRFRKWRRSLVLTAVMLVVLPLLIALLKSQFTIYCPGKLQHYGGYAADDYRTQNLPPLEQRRADCYPASHPSGGFALLAFGVSARRPRRKFLGYGLGLACGAVLSFIQIGRGEHFISHCLATCLIAWGLAWLLNALSHAIAAKYRRPEEVI